ncbi:uncharacterized protein [Lepeophtheirus salmonis]|uniref:uncharacterized protein n=1 Tax=Lepeophtheirus salmonis TaxID=72036 RepID=UPI001AE7C80D|nr:ribosomal RNA processing protein 1 homolog A-like [Lepeophtheirus salmonis]
MSPLPPSVEIQFAQKLAGNDVNVRDKALKKLKKWLSGNKALNPDEMLRLWKGLYYCYWMSDKPLIQEELSEKISELIHVFGSNEALALSYAESYFKTMNREWFGIDRWRMDKFLLLSRRFLRSSLNYLKSHSWNSLSDFMNIMEREVLRKVPQNDLGFRLHIIEIFLEEVAKVGGADFELSDTFLEVFLKDLAFGTESRIQGQVVKHIFHYLIKQSDIALAYDAFRRGELPSDSSDNEGNEEGMEVDPDNKGEKDDDIEEEETHLDPRAGKVSITLNQLIIDFSHVGNLLFEYGSKKEVKRVNRKRLYSLSKKYKEVAEGSYPFAIIEDEEDIARMKEELKEIDVNKLALQQTQKELKAIKSNVKAKKEVNAYIKAKELGLLNGNGENEKDEDIDQLEDDSESDEDEDMEDDNEENEKENIAEQEDNESSEEEESNLEQEGEEMVVEEEEESEEEIPEEMPSIGTKRKRNKVMSATSEAKKKRVKIDKSSVNPSTKQNSERKNLVRVKNITNVVEDEPSAQSDKKESSPEVLNLNIKLKGKSKKFKNKAQDVVSSLTSTFNDDQREETPSSPVTPSSSLFPNNENWGESDSKLNQPQETTTILYSTPSPKTPPLILNRLSSSQEPAVASESKVQLRKKKSLKKARKLSLPSSTKKVNFVMTKNKHQSLVQHHKSVVSSPEIPFLPDKRPTQGVLKVKGDVPETLSSPNPKILARNTTLNAKSKAAKLLFRSGMNGYFKI